MRPTGAPQTAPTEWRKASFCQGGECVELARLNGMVAMRDSGGHTLRYTTEEFRFLVRAIKAGEYDFER
jgi:hypothetical protein